MNDSGIKSAFIKNANECCFNACQTKTNKEIPKELLENWTHWTVSVEGAVVAHKTNTGLVLGLKTVLKTTFSEDWPCLGFFPPVESTAHPFFLLQLSVKLLATFKSN
ncbi:hypothetical protein XENORESO_005941 [Xenotaenia resolanae]|uniref:Uncharacterized protein n=1 Tax=Xenotaenia resolanae TaxID=208358 RepID=A0ABV0VXV1_9TELE